VTLSFKRLSFREPDYIPACEQKPETDECGDVKAGSEMALPLISISAAALSLPFRGSQGIQKLRIRNPRVARL